MVHELKIFQSLVVLQRHTVSVMVSYIVLVFMSVSQFDQVHCTGRGRAWLLEAVSAPFDIYGRDNQTLLLFERTRAVSLNAAAAAHFSCNPIAAGIQLP